MFMMQNVIDKVILKRGIRSKLDNFFLPLFPENLILTADHKTVKLADFGLAREESLTDMMTAETGTYRWMAPGVLNTQ